MWGESSNQCEMNCQCSGIMSDKFTLNSGSGSSKRRREEPAQHSLKRQMNPHASNLSPMSPLLTPNRRVLGELQNVRPSARGRELQESPISCFLNTAFLAGRPSGRLTRLIQDRSNFEMPKNIKKESPVSDTRAFKEVNNFNQNKENVFLGGMESQTLSFSNMKSGSLDFASYGEQNSHFGGRCLNFGQLDEQSIDLDKLDGGGDGDESLDRTANQTPSFSKMRSVDFASFGEQNCHFGGRGLDFGQMEEQTIDLDKLDGDGDGDVSLDRPASLLALERSKTDRNPTPLAKMSEGAAARPVFGLEAEAEAEAAAEAEAEAEALHDLEMEFDSDHVDLCSMYEIISTDSPDIISKGRADNRKITARHLAVFGAPLADTEPSTSFNLKPQASATRMLNFEEESEFKPETFKRAATREVTVKKSLKFSAAGRTSSATSLQRPESCYSGIGSLSVSPISSKQSLREPKSMGSLESGFISEVDHFLQPEEASSSPKMASFRELLSGQIKSELGAEGQQPTLGLNPAAALLDERRSHKRHDLRDDSSNTKKRRANCEGGFSNPRVQPVPESLLPLDEPLTQKAFSQYAAHVMSSLTRSVRQPDLTGDFSRACALPTTTGDHSDLKSISCETLDALLRGEYRDVIHDFQVIDCRYPYEFEGGHIRGARNLYTAPTVLGLMDSPPGSPDAAGAAAVPAGARRRRILIFHCEFSLERGPKLSRILRSADRARNADRYPELCFPEVYLLQGGYAAFNAEYRHHCEPAGYIAMMDPRHRLSLRQARSLK